MNTFVEFISKAYFIVEKRGGEPKYSDEHANINFYNHLVSSPEVRELIRKKDFDAVNQVIAQELENAKTDSEHPLHFNNAADEGFSGKKKTAGHENAYYSEIERAVPGFLSLIQSKKGGNIASKGWVGRVSGGEHEASKPSWKGNVKGQGRFDYVFSDPEDPKKQHRVSGKDYRGSQAGSAQADQATATFERGVEVAAQQQVKSILANKPKKKSGETEQEYKKRIKQLKLDARKKGKEIISTSQETLNRIKELMASTKGMSPKQQKDVYTQVQFEIDELEKKIPGVKRASGQEMVKGTGQFSKSKTAQSMWTTGGEGASFRDPRQQSVGLRARAGKGGGREMAIAGDIQAAPKEKESQKTRQSSFAIFNRQAAEAQQALAAAETEKANVQKELETNPDGSRTYLQHQGQKRLNNPNLSARLTNADQQIQVASTTLADVQARMKQATQRLSSQSQQQQSTQQPNKSTEPSQATEVSPTSSQPQQPQPTEMSPPEENQQLPPQQEKPKENNNKKRKKPEQSITQSERSADQRARMDVYGRSQGLPEYA